MSPPRPLWLSALWWTLFLTHAVWIFSLSQGPLPEALVPAWPGADKLYHAAQFGLWTFWGLQAIRPPDRRRLWLVIAGCWLYGLSDELHQRWVPGRQMDLIDWLADGTGILLVAGLWRRGRRRFARAG